MMADYGTDFSDDVDSDPTFKNLKLEAFMPRHVHNKGPLSK